MKKMNHYEKGWNHLTPQPRVQDTSGRARLRPRAQCAGLRVLQRSGHRGQPEEQHQHGVDHALAALASEKKSNDKQRQKAKKKLEKQQKGPPVLVLPNKKP